MAPKRVPTPGGRYSPRGAADAHYHYAIATQNSPSYAQPSPPPRTPIPSSFRAQNSPSPDSVYGAGGLMSHVHNAKALGAPIGTGLNRVSIAPVHDARRNKSLSVGVGRSSTGLEARGSRSQGSASPPTGSNASGPSFDPAKLGSKSCIK